jgi:hypothetical protein
LRKAWRGPAGFAALYPAVRAEDVPFAEDCLGDQYLLRGTAVFRLAGETGTVTTTELDLAGFLQRVNEDAVRFLGLQPLLSYERDGGRLRPGELLTAYPPFCTAEAAQGVSLKAVPAGQVHAFLADLARQLAGAPTGAKVRFKVVDGPKRGGSR